MFIQRTFRITAVAALCLMLGGAGLSMAQALSGTVTVSYTVSRIPGSASNQWAVWIEDGAGKFVKTLFVTDYMAREQGWKVRTQSLVNWVKAANVPDLPQSALDAVSGATPASGPHSAVWDLTDAAGRPVPAGVYGYRVEASLLRDNTAMFTGKIKIGGEKETSKAEVRYFPAGADTLGRVLISEVSAVFEPGK